MLIYYYTLVWWFGLLLCGLCCWLLGISWFGVLAMATLRWVSLLCWSFRFPCGLIADEVAVLDVFLWVVVAWSDGV